MKTPTFKFTLFTAIASVCATTALVANPTPALARATDTVTTHVMVHYGDLNLNKTGDADRLYIRLDRAAERACGAYKYDPLFLELWRGIRKCEHNAIGNAVTQVDSPKLTAVYDQHFQGFPSARAARATVGSSSKGSAVG